MPMVLLPPPWFSTITGCLRRAASCWPTMRARMSAPPPAAYGTMILMGLWGKSWHEARGARHERATVRIAASALGMRRVVIVLVGVRGMVGRTVPVVMLMHELLRHV